MELFLTSVNALVDSIIGPHNRTAIPLLCRLNGKKYKFPVLGHSDLKQADLTVLTPFLATISNMGVDLTDDPTVRHFRRLADLPTEAGPR